MLVCAWKEGMKAKEAYSKTKINMAKKTEKCYLSPLANCLFVPSSASQSVSGCLCCLSEKRKRGKRCWFNLIIIPFLSFHPISFDHLIPHPFPGNYSLPSPPHTTVSARTTTLYPEQQLFCSFFNFLHPLRVPFSLRPHSTVCSFFFLDQEKVFCSKEHP